MKAYGEPWQYSVFYCTLKAIDRVRLETALLETMNQKEDQVLILDLGGNEDAARESSTFLGTGVPQQESEGCDDLIDARATTSRSREAVFNGAAALAAETRSTLRTPTPQAMLQWGRDSQAAESGRFIRPLLQTQYSRGSDRASRRRSGGTGR